MHMHARNSHDWVCRPRRTIRNYTCNKHCTLDSATQPHTNAKHLPLNAHCLFPFHACAKSYGSLRHINGIYHDEHDHQHNDNHNCSYFGGIPKYCDILKLYNDGYEGTS